MASHDLVSIPEPATAPSAAFIRQLNEQLLLVRCLGIVAELGIADLVSKRAMNSAELAAATGADALTLYRVLRFLASFKFFRADEEGAFHPGPGAELLRDNGEGSHRERLRLPWQSLIWDTYRALPEAVMSGKTAFDIATGRSFFEYLAEHKDIGAAFDRSMAQFSQPENAAVSEYYDFSRTRTVVDLGGGRGGLLAAILSGHPHVRGVLYDQPHVLSEPLLVMRYVQEQRCEVRGGDFFKTVPAGADVYLLKRVLHDWDDAHASRILQAVRAAVKPGGKLLVMDAIVERGNEPDFNKFMDVNIMALTAGRERTLDEFRGLLDSAGFELLTAEKLAVPTGISLLEAVANAAVRPRARPAGSSAVNH